MVSAGSSERIEIETAFFPWNLDGAGYGVQDFTEKEEADEFLRAGSFESRLTLAVVSELNRRNILYRLDETDQYNVTLKVLRHALTEAAEIISDVKHKHKRVRF